MAPAAARPVVRVDIVSDTVCPWCYVGKRRLEAAIKPFSDKLNFEVRWHPFQLNPAAPQEGVNKLAFYYEKFGPRVEAMLPHMTATFAELGVKYSMGGLTGNTLRSHLLIAWAGRTEGWRKQNQLVEELFLNYFSQEKYINDTDVLVAAAKTVGLDASEAARILAAPPSDLVSEVQKELRNSRVQGISGVPFFTINGSYTLSGAQPPSQFAAVFEEIARTSSTAGGQVEGAVCTPGGACL